MTQTEVLKLALEALETYHGYMEPLLTVFGGPRVPAEKSTTYKVEKAITAIKEALAQPEQELIAWPCVIAEADFSLNTVTLTMQCTDYKVSAGKHWLSTTPPQRKPLEEYEIEQCVNEADFAQDHIQSTRWVVDFARAIEAAHGIKE